MNQTDISDVGGAGENVVSGFLEFAIGALDLVMLGVIAPNVIAESLIKFRLVAIMHSGS